jgi:hypothetical protein
MRLMHGLTLSPSLAALALIPRWVNYTLEPDPDRPGKTIKRPVNSRTGYNMAVTDVGAWSSYAQACARSPLRGFIFSDLDDYWFLDIDDCLVDGQWSALAQDLCRRLAGAAVEVSQSGKGLHLFGRGTVPPHSSRNIAAGIELYTTGRFVALTDSQTTGDVTTDHSAALASIVETFFPHNPHGEIAGWTDSPVPDYGGPEDDVTLLKVALASGKKSMAAAFGDAITFADLWHADADKLAVKFPSPNGDFDHSLADASLASHLAYWTGNNHERIREIMFQSALAREKWELRPDWLELTILKASSVVTNVLRKRDPVPSPIGVEATPAAAAPAAVAGPAPVVTTSIEMRVAGREFLALDDQLSFFAGAVYVTERNEVWIPSNGELLDKARFDVIYGGHVFSLDHANDKTTDSAWDAFTKSKMYKSPRADMLAFRPECTPGSILVEDGRTMINSFVPIFTRRVVGPVKKFHEHMARILPDENDRRILYHYLASMVQNVGHKAQWWPLIQGAEGNGKSFLNRLMQFCMGARYSHLVNPQAAEKSGNQFNGWIEGNLFVGIEEIYVKGRRDFLESFKTTITDDRIAKETKGVDQNVGDNRCNGLLFSNHLDAVPVTIDSRRYCIFYCAQQSYADILRDGMGGNYFPDLYDWFYGRGDYAEHGAHYGAACINEWLATYAMVDELNPAKLCVRAPTTSSTKTAFSMSLGLVEQEILEAIGQGREGFAGGWISSIAVDRILDALRVQIPRTKRRDIMLGLGYDVHPGLEGGRVPVLVKPDNAKPVLYVANGHLSLQLLDPVAIGKAYTAAQESRTAETFGAAFKNK